MKEYQIVTPCYHSLVQISTLVVAQSLAQLPQQAGGYRFESILGTFISSLTFPSFSPFFLVVTLSHAHTQVNKHNHIPHTKRYIKSQPPLK